MRILLADDHTLVRAGIRALLERIPEVEVIAEASDGRDAVKLAESLHPDMVVIDVVMPTLNGLDAAARVLKASPQIKVIMLSMYANEEYVLEALRVGAAGYLLKDAATTELLEAIQAVRRGDTYLSPAIEKKVRESRLASGKNVQPGGLGAVEQLSDRQREILQLLAEGKSTKEIAFLLNVSAKTVETHRSRLMERLNVHDLPALVRIAMRAGMIAPDK